jgi:alkaline phosphatase D
MATPPIAAEVKLPDGTLWKNIVTEDKSKPAETLAEFRGNFKYNMIDKNVRAFNAEVPMFAQWDDHETYNNWWPGEPLPSNEHRKTNYQSSNGLLLAARASRAFHEYMPLRPTASEAGRVYRKIGYGPLLDVFMLDMRSYRGPNGEGKEDTYGPAAYFLGPQQMAWLKRELMASRATWKVIAADMPIGLVVYHDAPQKWGVEAVAQGMDGPPRGRELEIADLLAFIKHAGVRNTVWLTADVHYTAAHYYDPNKAAFQDFEPFWEFVSGPLHAGSFGPNDLDKTFGPQLMYVKAPTKEQGQNLSPASGLQFFGHVAVDGASGVMTVTLKDMEDQALWSTNLEPK